MIDDGIDFVSRTQAQMDACARRGLWHYVKRLGGFKSEELAREAYKGLRLVASPSYAPNLKTPERDMAGVITAVKALPERTFSNSQGVDVQPASREWVLKCRGRIAGMGLKVGDVSVSMGRCKSYISNRFMPTGHCSAEAKAAINAHLDYLETVVKSS